MEENYISTLIAVGGTLLGGFGGALLTHFLTKNRETQKLIFDSRKSAYSQFVGLSRNMILNRFSSDELKTFQRITSECLMLTSEIVREKIIMFANNLDKQKHMPVLSHEYEVAHPKSLIAELKELEIILKKDLNIK